MAAEAQLRGGTGLSRTEALELVNKVRLRAYNQEKAEKFQIVILRLISFSMKEPGSYTLNLCVELTL